MKNKQSNLVQQLVAHRGDSDHYPENSLQGYQSALNIGACYVETDIQITKDNVPILCHDASLKKMTGHDILVSECNFDDIKDLSASYASKFGSQYTDFKLTTLSEMSELMARYPKTQFFVEIKDECVVSHGHQALDIILADIENIQSQVILISFNYQILTYAKQVCDLPIGWVWPEESPMNRIQQNKQHVAMCKELNPDYVFCDKDLLPLKKSQFWKGDWLKAVYTIATLEEFETYEKMGFGLFETNNITGHSAEIGML